MSNMEYFKCPCCSGTINYDTTSKKLKCAYCDSEFPIETLENYNQDINDTVESDFTFETVPNGEWQAAEINGLYNYICKHCGGELITDNTTIATNCPYCGNAVVLNNEIKNSIKPDYVLPFKTTREDAKKAYLNHVSSKKMAPKAFKEQNHIDEIKGIYVPFWLYDADVDMAAKFTAEKQRAWSDEDYDYVEHSYYSLFRAGGVSFANVPSDGSSKIDSTIMESIEPFNVNEAVDFQTAYLAGFFADKYDLTSEESSKKAYERIKNSSINKLKETVNEYDDVKIDSIRMGFDNESVKYCLLPVWLLNTTYNGEKYTFAMNGQTGKFVGNLPVDAQASRSNFWGTFVVVFIIAMAINFGLTLL